MQTTLLGLAIAIILAIVAALIAPLVVDWNHYRSTFEAEASRLTGLTVHVHGAIEARILPSPVIKLRDVEVGGAGRDPQLRAGTIELEVGLGPLLRGEVRASQMHLIAPQINLALDSSGAVDWPALSPSFRPQTLSISRLNVEDGRVVLRDAASGLQIVLQKFWFNGDIRSFAGPFNGDGAFVVGDELYGYRISGNRVAGTPGIKIRLGVDPTNHPLTTDVEGTLTFDHGAPQFEGTLSMARPVGAALASGQRVMSDPWHAAASLHATPTAASLQDVVFQYGPEERALNFSGRAQLTFGRHPHFNATVAALQLDLDRALAAPDVTHRPPLMVIKNFLAAYAGAVKLPMPGEVGVGIDAVTVGGTTIQSLQGDVDFDDAGWSVKRLAFRAPGFTQVNLSGRLTDTAAGFAFNGPATLESTDVDMLLAWLKGRSDLPSGQAKALSARGDVTIASDRIAVDRLTAALDRENVEGRLAYAWPAGNRPAALDADLHAATLDLDALTTFAKAALAANVFEMPHAGSLALDIGKATFAGVDAQAIKAQIKFDAGKLQIDRLSVGALGGAALAVSGRIDELSSRPRGQITLDLDAQALTGLIAVVGKFAPPAANSLQRFADRLAPAKVHAVLSVAHATAGGSSAKLNLDGQMGAMRVGFDGEADGELAHLGNVVVRVDSHLDALDGEAITTLLGLDRVLAVDRLPGRATLTATGPLNGDLHVDGQVAVSGLDATVRGAVRLNGGERPTATLQVLASAGDFRPLQQAMTGQPGAAVSVSARASVAVAGKDVTITDLAAAIGAASVHGHLALTLSSPIGIDGAVTADTIDAARVSEMLLGLPVKTSSAGAPWSGESIAAGAFMPMAGTVTFKFDRAAFTPALVASDLKGVAHFRPSEIAVDGIDGKLAGGHVTGALAFRHDLNGLVAHAHVALAGAAAATIIAPDKNAVDGQLTIDLQCDSIAPNPVGLVGALHGSGTVSVANAHFHGFDPAAFEAAIRAADDSRAIEQSHIQAAVSTAMANGRLAVPQGTAALTITAGRVSLANATLPAQNGAALSLNGALDLNTETVDARMTLSGPPPANALIGSRPELLVSLKGALAAPQRTLDISALTGWLTLRSAELQTRRIQSIEADRRDSVLGPVVRPQPPAVHEISRGTMVETTLPANVPPPPGTHVLERLQPVLPPAAPDANHPPAGGADHGPALGILPQLFGIKPAAPRPPVPRTNNGAANTVPAEHSRLDTSVRPQN